MEEHDVNAGHAMAIACAACSAALILLPTVSPVAAQDAAPSPPDSAEQPAGGDNLAQQLTNPIADLVSIPFQFNWRQGVGPQDDLQFNLNIQPVVPFGVTDHWNLVARFVVPLISQPVLVPGGAPRFGLGDGLLSLFASPASDSAFQWGVGPVVAVPFTTDPLLGSGKWSAGPTAVALYMAGGWTLVLLANHLWSFANTGDIDRDDVSQSYVQPVVSYTTESAWTFSVSSEASINWEASDDDKLTLPVLGTVAKLLALGPFPMSVGLGGGVYAAAPEGGPEWQLRLATTVLLPKAPKK